jgi:putative Mg2+ transporter-C (MgtC) family protein
VSEAEVVARVALAGLLGTALGLERERRGHAAGVRTHALVACGAALFTVAGAYGFPSIHRGPNVDPMRVAAQVASGIGFVGAGAILREGLTVRGLTTASTIWVAGALGLAVGAGLYLGAIGALAVILALLVLLRIPQVHRLFSPLQACTLDLEYERGHGTLGILFRGLAAIAARIDSVSVIDDGPPEAGGLRRVTARCMIDDLDALSDVATRLGERPEVRSATVS